MRIAAAWFCMAIALACLGGCLGYVRGYENLPYVGGNEPERDKYIDFEGVSVYIDVKNTTTTHQAYWIGREVPILPVYLSVREKPTFGWKRGDPLQIKAIVNIQRPAFVFDPKKIVLMVGEEFFPLKAAMFHLGPGPGEEDLQPVAQPMVLKDTGMAYQFTLTFGKPTPSPPEIMVLDLAEALRHPELPSLPKIFFSKMSWSRWYSREGSGK